MHKVALLSDGLLVRCLGGQGHETQRLTEARIDAMAPAYVGSLTRQRSYRVKQVR